MRKLTGKESSDLPPGVDLPDGMKTKKFPKGLELSEATKHDRNGESFKVTEMAIYRTVTMFDLMTGKFSKWESRHDYHSVPEFSAILITNVYISEKNHRHGLCGPRELMTRGDSESGCYDLRKDHSGASAPVALREPARFLENHWDNFLTEKLWDSQSRLCNQIALAPAEFNPLRTVAIRRHPEKFAVEFLMRHDVTKESYNYFILTMKELRRSLGPKRFQLLLNGRVLTDAADPGSNN